MNCTYYILQLFFKITLKPVLNSAKGKYPENRRTLSVLGIIYWEGYLSIFLSGLVLPQAKAIRGCWESQSALDNANCMDVRLLPNRFRSAIATPFPMVNCIV
jgi:hypothetical protein